MSILFALFPILLPYTLRSIPYTSSLYSSLYSLYFFPILFALFPILVKQEGWIRGC